GLGRPRRGHGSVRRHRQGVRRLPHEVSRQDQLGFAPPSPAANEGNERGQRTKAAATPPFFVAEGQAQKERPVAWGTTGLLQPVTGWVGKRRSGGCGKGASSLVACQATATGLVGTESACSTRASAVKRQVRDAWIGDRRSCSRMFIQLSSPKATSSESRTRSRAAGSRLDSSSENHAARRSRKSLRSWV